MKYLNRRSCGWLLVFSAFLASCGYQFEPGGYLHNDITRVAVTILENNSSETGAGVTFTNALIQEILQRTDTMIVDPSRSAAVLKGTIKAITFATLSRSTTETVVERRVWAVVDLQLINREGEVVWSVKDFSTHEDYRVSDDQVEDDINKRTAVDKIAIRSAEKLINKLLTNF